MVWPRFSTRRSPFSRSSEETTSSLQFDGFGNYPFQLGRVSSQFFNVNIFQRAEQLRPADHAALQCLVESSAEFTVGQSGQDRGSIRTVRG